MGRRNWLSATEGFNCLSEVGQAAISSDTPDQAGGVDRLLQRVWTGRHKHQHGRCLAASPPPDVPVAAFCASGSGSCSDSKQPGDNRVAELFPSGTKRPSRQRGRLSVYRCF